MEKAFEVSSPGQVLAHAPARAHFDVASVPLGSVVIPAHNEASVIGRCLDALMHGTQPGELQVIVVCNGCTDGTADLSRRHAPTAAVIELAEASKAAALREGERISTAMPRLYLDADVVVPGSTARALLDALAKGAPAARPRTLCDASGSSPLVRSYYRVRDELPSLAQHAWGAGVYGLSEKGRARFEVFPEVVADDFWVDGLFGPGEIVVVDAAPGVIIAPTSPRMLLRVLRRWQRGKRECIAAGTPAPGTEAAVARDLVSLVRRRPSRIVDVVVYVSFALAARVQLMRSAVRWERDESSRQP